MCYKARWDDIHVYCTKVPPFLVAEEDAQVGQLSGVHFSVEN